MGAPTAITATSAAGGRLKREEASSVKHDSTFSQWKILIGASDWKDLSLGKEGAVRYRIHNLPNCTSCPGVYELGVGISRPRLGRDERKLDSSAVVPVYLGQADNVRNRLQQYGREGAHLGNRCSNGEAVGIYQSICSDRGPGLFTEIFSKGFQIVYRWAPMKNKKDAEITEALLLEKFDYAWNRGSNGARRTDDILKKLDLYTRESLFSLLSKKIRLFNRKRVGIEIKNSEPFFVENRDDLCTDIYNNRIFSKIFKIRRSQPILVSSSYSSSNVCGVAIGNGSVCTEPRVEGRKRCPEHKGMKVNGFTSKLNIERKDSSDGYQNHGLTHGVINQPYSFELHINNNNHLPTTCGVILDDGSPCKRPPTHRNKRCMVHKGRRVSRSTPKFVGEVEQNSLCSGRDVCGVKIEDGQICTRQPVSGRKRCSLHKGMKCF
ncbi:LOW QUALITY PROTEIN: protein EFFECTOR OF TRANSCRIPTION 2-like [Primulina tabacum]|uniref:LOW QUALITY PROTEIN: protein EFFECTOR OF TRANSCRIPTION 2-like n=1 Tax=Primulina tabacum TaxID=48773 RepID=UPI003F593D8D